MISEFLQFFIPTILFFGAFVLLFTSSFDGYNKKFKITKRMNGQFGISETIFFGLFWYKIGGHWSRVFKVSVEGQNYNTLEEAQEAAKLRLQWRQNDIDEKAAKMAFKPSFVQIIPA